MDRAELGNQIQEYLYASDLEKYAPPYIPENFTPEEVKYLNPFFSNIDQPVFIVEHLPEEVIGALSAKYSRATESMRRTFLKEYVYPIIHPEEQKDWTGLKAEDKAIEITKKEKFEEFIDYLNSNGGINYVVNIQRGRKFFDKWLVDYGDDSISEMGGIHLCIEGLSNIATKEIEDQRVGLSPIEKSSRYVSFAEKLPDGNYRYVVPGEIKGTPYEKPYMVMMDTLFSTYSELMEPYLAYIKKIYPQGEDETASSFEKSRRAKVFDDLRDLLPFSTITNVGLYGNGRAYEYLVNRLAEHPLGELRYWAYKVANEINKVTPSFIRRLNSPIGKDLQAYKSNLRKLRDELSVEQFGVKKPAEKVVGAKLLEYTKDGETDVLAAFIFGGGSSPSLDKVRDKVRGMSESTRRKLFLRIFSERSAHNTNPKREQIRFKKIHRSFENSKYMYELWLRGGDYRDLHRHRQLTQERQKFTTRLGYDLEHEVTESPFARRVELALSMTAPLYEILTREYPDAAQYLVPFSYIQHCYMNLTARELYYMAELRTGPQGRPHYRKIVQEMARQAIDVHPDLFAGMVVDWNDYSLARRESEKRIERKKKELDI